MPVPDSSHTQSTPKSAASTTPEERRKFVVLAILASVVVILLWVWTLPYNFRKESGPEAAGPVEFFQRIGDQLGSATGALKNYKNDTDAARGN